MYKKDFFIVVAQGFILGLLIYVLHFVLQNVFSFSIPREDPFKSADALVESIWLKVKLYWPYSLLGFCGLIGMTIGIAKSIDFDGFHLSKWLGIAALSFIVFTLSVFQIFG
ncbi:hypothetical protein V2T33_05780 [Streptococcus agalactiae]|uniref:hypothetical protein n=1 Tax=Streptococcus agalactiae TaxID=1311 RepID=UPI0002F4F996|nr:hypothetical protein [Streptococcus agalactiae]EPW99874.1 hypothetical protein SAG0144_10945 [Streptococcus agalactiae MRI Z1-035]